MLTQQSFLGKICKTWSYSNKNNKAEKTLSNKKGRFLKDYEDRLSLTQIECRDAIKVIKARDYKDAFFYIDPPYFNSDMGHYSGYSQNDFKDLLIALKSLQGRFLLSSYPSDLLTSFVEDCGWKQHSFKQNLSASRKGKSKVEVLTLNY